MRIIKAAFEANKNNRFVFDLLILLLVFLSSCVENKSEFELVFNTEKQKILDQIEEPVFPDQHFLLSDFGGNGDGIFDNKPIFDSIISYCNRDGGGRIIVSPGEYLINGPIHLLSNINLYLEEGSKIIFGSNTTDYLPVVLTSWEGTRVYNYSPFIYANGAKNIAITGRGEVNGSASNTWAMWRNLQEADIKECRRMNNEGVPLEARIFGEGHYLRPHLIQFYNCENILVEGITIKDSPFWCVHTVFSNNIVIRNISFDAQNFNNDGIDPESSSNVLIENVSFNNNDDNIAIKAGRDLEARTLKIPSQNILIRNCYFKGHNAIAIGSEMSGGVENVFVEDCSFAGNVLYGIYIKGNRDRGGVVKNIYVDNVGFDSTKSVIMIDSDYKQQGTCCPPAFKNINIHNIKSNFARDFGISLNGFESMPLDSVVIENVEIIEAKYPFESNNVENLSLSGIVINGAHILLNEP